ncbi:Hypothetical predicted protein [Mytilus galloprovincialis]|uniref:Uncharacterized protein n=1 Tax=Mytilus galloprovincialis TaxID=29158 RepID=A0A8B6D763_MYTGA|nr:Hypothetical predicted protein [Mytilus galloprovincialis]
MPPQSGEGEEEEEGGYESSRKVQDQRKIDIEVESSESDTHSREKKRQRIGSPIETEQESINRTRAPKDEKQADGILHHSKEDNIDCQVKQKKRLINLMAFTYDLDFEDYTKEKQREKNDQFDLLDYTPCSRFDLIQHFYNLVNLTKEHLDSVNFITHNKVTSFNLEVTEDNNTSQQEQNLRYNIDGEIYSIKTPNLFVKLHPRCYNVYSSYTGPLRWS